MNEALIDLLKQLIFRTVARPAVRLVLLSPHQNSNGSAEEPGYTVAVYEMPVDTLQRCTLPLHTNAPDPTMELTHTLAQIFAANVSVQLHSVCLATNVMRPEALVMPVSGTGGQEECAHTQCTAAANVSREVAAFSAALAGHMPLIAYTETCVLQAEVAVTAHFDHLAHASPYADTMRGHHEDLAFGHMHQLTTSTQAIFCPIDPATDVTGIVQVFASLNTDALVHRDSGGSSMLSGSNYGMSASEKSSCLPHTTATSCRQTLTVSRSHEPGHTNTPAYETLECIEIEAYNARVDIEALKRLVLRQTTASMLQPRGIRIYNELDAHVKRVSCSTGEHTVVTERMSADTSSSSRFDITPKHTVRLSLRIRHVSPFTHNAGYVDHVLRFVPAHEVGQVDMASTAVVHLHVIGLSLAQVPSFSATLRGYVAPQTMHNSSNHSTTVQFAEVHLILQYAATFPESLFDDGDSRDQMYIRVHLSGMQTCGDMKSVVPGAVFRDSIQGTPTIVTIIDSPAVSLHCETLVSLEYASTECSESVRLPLRQLRGAKMSGGIVSSSEVACLPSQGPDCVAQLFSTNAVLFYDMLRMLTVQLDPLAYSFRHRVRFCGLDADLLAAVLTPDDVGFSGRYGECHARTLSISCVGKGRCIFSVFSAVSHMATVMVSR